MLIDTHVHLDHPRLASQLHSLMAGIHAAGVEKVIVPAITYEGCFDAEELFAPYPWVYYGPGIHPNRIPMLREMDPVCTEGLYELAQAPKTVALKTGLDYYRTTEPAQQDRQRVWFQRIVSIAQETGLPLILHVRQAEEDAVKILRAMGGEFSGVVHCYCGDLETARTYADMGLCLGIGGAVTLELPALRKTVAEMPAEYLLLETDAPFVRPAGIPSGPNTPEYLPVIAVEIAELRGMKPEEIASITSGNACRIFRLD